MKLRYWKVSNKKILFPEKWNKKKVGIWLNTNIRTCPFCHKIDVKREHFNTCHPQSEAYRQVNIDYYN